jgi:hypothetical protein
MLISIQAVLFFSNHEPFRMAQKKKKKKMKGKENAKKIW